MVYCDAGAWVNYSHADVCSPGSPPAYTDYGTNPHTDSCNASFSAYADTGGLPLCPAAYQGAVYIDESACHSNVAFSNVAPHSNVAHADHYDSYQNWPNAYQNWSNAHANVAAWSNAPHSHSCSSHVDAGGQTAPGCPGEPNNTWTNADCYYYVYCANNYRHRDGYSAHSQSYVFSSTPHSDQPAAHTDVAATHTDYYASHSDSHTDWSNYIHTSHKNFCNHSNTNLG